MSSVKIAFNLQQFCSINRMNMKETLNFLPNVTKLPSKPSICHVRCIIQMPYKEVFRRKGTCGRQQNTFPSGNNEH
jgi:hypothetical protein